MRLQKIICSYKNLHMRLKTPNLAFPWPGDFSEEGLFIRDKEPTFLVCGVSTREYGVLAPDNVVITDQ